MPDTPISGLPMMGRNLEATDTLATDPIGSPSPATSYFTGAEIVGGVVENLVSANNAVVYSNAFGNITADSAALGFDGERLAVTPQSFEPTAAIHIDSTNKGILGPRLTTSEMNSILSPPDGLRIYNTSIDTEMVRKDGDWKPTYSSPAAEMYLTTPAVQTVTGSFAVVSGTFALQPIPSSAFWTQTSNSLVYQGNGTASVYISISTSWLVAGAPPASALVYDLAVGAGNPAAPTPQSSTLHRMSFDSNQESQNVTLTTLLEMPSGQGICLMLDQTNTPLTNLALQSCNIVVLVRDIIL